MSLSKCHPEAAFAKGKSAHPALLTLLWSAALVLGARPCVGAATVPLVSEVNASPPCNWGLAEAVVTPSASCVHWLKWEINDLPKAVHLKVTFYLEMICLYVLHGAAEAGWQATMVDRKEAAPLLDHRAVAGPVLTPNVNSEGLSTRPFVRGGACPPQWLPVFLAISVSPSPQTPLPLSINADHPGADVDAGVGELPDAEVIIIESLGLLAEVADHMHAVLTADRRLPPPSRRRRRRPTEPVPPSAPPPAAEVAQQAAQEMEALTSTLASLYGTDGATAAPPLSPGFGAPPAAPRRRHSRSRLHHHRPCHPPRPSPFLLLLPYPRRRRPARAVVVPSFARGTGRCNREPLRRRLFPSPGTSSHTAPQRLRTLPALPAPGPADGPAAQGGRGGTAGRAGDGCAHKHAGVAVRRQRGRRAVAPAGIYCPSGSPAAVTPSRGGHFRTRLGGLAGRFLLGRPRAAAHRL